MNIEHSQIDQDKVVNVRQAQQEKQKFLTKIKPHKGHTLFEYNVLTSAIQEAAVEVIAIVDKSGTTRKEKRVKVKRNCLYVSALNQKNAVKKLIKRHTT